MSQRGRGVEKEKEKVFFMHLYLRAKETNLLNFPIDRNIEDWL